MKLSYLLLLLLAPMLLQAQPRPVLAERTSPDGRYTVVHTYGEPLLLKDTRTGESRPIAQGSQPVWDASGRLHFISIVEDENHVETLLFHVHDPETGLTALLPAGADRPTFVPDPPQPRTRAKRAAASTAAVTGLSGWTIFLDPGHSRTENMGLFNYSEAQKTLRVGLELRRLLLEETDIDTVWIARQTDDDLIGLSDRPEWANFLGADFYYSIHSNAGSPGTNNTLMLWGANGQGVEKTPQGGKRMGDIMIQDLTAAMRIPTIGSRADSPFYGATSRTQPYLAVNRISNMASVLSEAGFHTNPQQQQRNLNRDWKRLEARSAYWSILRYHGLSRPQVGILTGYVVDHETGRPINGATVALADTTYTTDTYDSLFRFYSIDPEELANGFYYLDQLVPGSAQSLTVTAEGYYAVQRDTVLSDTTFTFTDIRMVSNRPPFVVSASVAAASETYVPGDAIRIRFSRPMNRASVEAALSAQNATLRIVGWMDDVTLDVALDGPFLTEYTLSISDAGRDQYDHAFIPWQLVFRSGPEDAIAPVVVSTWPLDGTTRADQLTLVTIEFDEELGTELPEHALVVRAVATGDTIPVRRIDTYAVNDRFALQWVPMSPLPGNAEYEVILAPGITDRFANATTSATSFRFTTSQIEETRATIDAFANVTSWWVPQQSGSTAGVETDFTSRSASAPGFDPLSGGTAMHLNFGWRNDTSTWLIRQYMIPDASNNLRFSTTNRFLEAWVRGDGSGVRFRFMLRDGSGQLEGSPWYAIDWIGWRKVRWDLRTGTSTGWVTGNGVLDGTLYTDSFQLTHVPGNAMRGTIAIDDYAVVTLVSDTGTERDESEEESASRITLDPAYPNPFNPATQIRFSLPASSPIRLAVYDLLGRQVATLVDGIRAEGTHEVRFDATGLASGIYLVRLEAGGEMRTRRITLLQ